jgi:hypothetical protein
LNSKNSWIFDDRSCIIRRQKFAESAEKDLSCPDDKLVIINGEGGGIVSTEEFEELLYHVGKQPLEQSIFK